MGDTELSSNGGFTPLPLPLPPRPSTAIGGFTPRDRSPVDAGSFLFGFFLGAVSAALLGLIIILAVIS